MSTAICPSCGEDVRLRATLEIGAQVVCMHCDTDLEVVNLDPVELDWAYYDDYDDDEDDGDFYD